MAEDATRIAADIDFERDGKQISHLAVPHSRDESAWGVLPVPVVCVKNGKGPTLLLTGGSHGDEYEGPVALTKLARGLEPASIRGRVIVLPALNLPALRAGRRLSPIDGKNMNRVFPGEARGSITAAVAHYVTAELLPRADAVVDLHSGGGSLVFLPAAVAHRLDDPDRMAATLAALESFGAPAGLVLRELDAAGMLDSTVEAMGKIFLSTELGGGGMLSPRTVAIAEAGIRNLLAHFGIAGPPAPPAAPTRLLEVPDDDCYAMAAEDGLYEPFLEVGGEVKAGAELGQIHFVEAPDRDPVPAVARRGGLLVCRRAQGWTVRGDCLGLVARDLAPH